MEKQTIEQNKSCSRCENLEDCTIELSLQDENPEKFVCDNFKQKEGSSMKYRKKPTAIIEAIKWDGENTEEIEAFVGQKLKKQMSVAFDNKEVVFLLIPTLESPHEASVGDFIIKGVRGEFYPCKADIFEETYEEVI